MTPEIRSPHLFRKVTNSGKSKKPLLSHVSFCRVGQGRGMRCECVRGMAVIETERRRDGGKVRYGEKRGEFRGSRGWEGCRRAAKDVEKEGGREREAIKVEECSAWISCRGTSSVRLGMHSTPRKPAPSERPHLSQNLRWQTGGIGGEAVGTSMSSSSSKRV